MEIELCLLVSIVLFLWYLWKYFRDALVAFLDFGYAENQSKKGQCLLFCYLDGWLKYRLVLTHNEYMYSVKQMIFEPVVFIACGLGA